jgi:hypothetical protein
MAAHLERVRCDATPAWVELQGSLCRTRRGLRLRQAFAADAQRFASLSQEAPHVFADLSKNLVDATTEACCSTWPNKAAWRNTATRCSPAKRSTPPNSAP